MPPSRPRPNPAAIGKASAYAVLAVLTLEQQAKARANLAKASDLAKLALLFEAARMARNTALTKAALAKIAALSGNMNLSEEGISEDNPFTTPDNPEALLAVQKANELKQGSIPESDSSEGAGSVIDPSFSTPGGSQTNSDLKEEEQYNPFPDFNESEAPSTRNKKSSGSNSSSVAPAVAGGVDMSLRSEETGSSVASGARTAADRGGNTSSSSESEQAGLSSEQTDNQGEAKAPPEKRQQALSAPVQQAKQAVKKKIASSIFDGTRDVGIAGGVAILPLVAMVIVWNVLWFLDFTMGFKLKPWQKAMVAIVDLVIFFALLILIAISYILVCKGPSGWLLWTVSWFSETAASTYQFCQLGQ